MGAATFTQAQIARAVQGAKKAGLDVAAVELRPDGAIRVLTKVDTPAPPRDGEAPEPWDDD